MKKNNFKKIILLISALIILSGCTQNEDLSKGELIKNNIESTSISGTSGE